MLHSESMAKPEPNNGVRIGSREIYDAVIATQTQVSSLTGEIGGIRQQIREIIAPGMKELKDRTRSLELRWYGIAAGLIGGLVYIITYVLGK